MSTLRAALAERVVVADGAMGTMLPTSAAAIDDFAGYEGCNEILTVAAAQDHAADVIFTVPRQRRDRRHHPEAKYFSG
ncbi:MAG: hypothetical protein M3Z75_15135 [Actinomycetota bacterium]|nr:hypothetical protein [Actinomycetota bacterium]